MEQYILSRNSKCKVIIGFGSWARRDVWPLQWLMIVKTVKMFGIILCNSYRDIVKLNWDHRYKKSSDTVYSWKNRVLVIISQRIEVLRTFALSRVYYVASILPLGTSMVKKFKD